MTEAAGTFPENVVMVRDHLAARWLIDQEGNDFTDAQRDALVHWLTSDPDNCRRYVEMVRSWRKTLLLTRADRIVVYQVLPDDPEQLRRVTRVALAALT